MNSNCCSFFDASLHFYININGIMSVLLSHLIIASTSDPLTKLEHPFNNENIPFSSNEIVPNILI